MPNIKRDAKKNAALKYHGVGSIHATTATTTTITARMRVSTPAVIDDLGSSIDVCPKAPSDPKQGKSGSPCSRFELATTLPKYRAELCGARRPSPCVYFVIALRRIPATGSPIAATSIHQSGRSKRRSHALKATYARAFHFRFMIDCQRNG
jgi:hypothetical protein